MITIIARMKFKDGKEDEALSKVKTMAEAVAANEPGAIAYLVHRNQKDPSEIIFFELYEDAAASEAHGKTAHMAAMRESFAEIFDPATFKVEILERVGGHLKAG